MLNLKNLNGVIQRERQYCSMSLESWKEEVTAQRGAYSQRLKLGPLTNGSGYSSWRTPQASDGEKGGPNQRDSSGALHLAAQAAMWPTPHGMGDGKSNGPSGNELGRAVNQSIRYPTPKTPTGGGQMTRNIEGGGIRKLEDRVGQLEGYNTGSLNPHFVEWLQGISKNWTALDGELMDHNDWNGEWEGVPRVTKDCANRVDRLRLLGNGVVPATAAKAWTVFSERLQHDV